LTGTDVGKSEPEPELRGPLGAIHGPAADDFQSTLRTFQRAGARPRAEAEGVGKEQAGACLIELSTKLKMNFNTNSVKSAGLGQELWGELCEVRK